MPDGPAADDTARIAANRALWDERVPIHVTSRFYDVDGFRSGQRRLAIEAFEVDEVGPVEGRTLAHLQCHFGLDTLSWARLGAQVTGLDFSQPAVDAARQLALDIDVEAEFVCADLYAAVEALGRRTFDVVYTGKGALLWLPDLTRWAQVCADLVSPGGTLYLSEFHPVMDMYAWETLELERSYFETAPQFDDSEGTYADFTAPTACNESYEWQHPLGDVVTAVVEAGLQVRSLREWDFNVYSRWPFMERHDDGTYHFPEGMPKLPLMYSVVARKPAR